MTAQERATEIKGVFVAAFTFLTALWGWLGWAVLLLALAMLIDYITGSAAARAKGEWSSPVARAGIRHKLGEIIAVGAAAFADLGVQVALHSVDLQPLIGQVAWPHVFTMIVVLWYLFTELGSILENAGELGAPIPVWLRKGIKVLQAKTDEAGSAVSGSDTEDGETEQPKGKHEKTDDGGSVRPVSREEAAEIIAEMKDLD